MAITLTKAPASIAFSKNPIPVELTTDNLYSTTPSAFEFRLYLQGTTNTGLSKSGAISADETITFEWQDRTVTLTAKASPLNNGYQIPSGVGNLAHANNIKSYLEYNKIILNDFLITVVSAGGDLYLKINSKRNEIFPTVSFNGLTAHSTLINETLGAERPNFKILTEYFMADQGSDIYNSTGARFDFVDSTGKVILDISEFINPNLEFDKPTLRETNITRCTKSIKKYYFVYNELYGANPVMQNYGWSSNYVVLRGGLSRRQHPDNAFFTQYLTNKFLTWYQNDQLVRKTQPCYLTYLFRTPSLTQLRIRVETTYKSNPVAVKFTTAVTVNLNDKLSVPCGYSQLNVGSEYPLDSVISYKVTLVRHDSNVAVSESRNFIVDTSYKPYLRHFLFESSLGGVEVITTFGKASNEYNIIGQSAEIKLPAVYSPSDADEIEYGNKNRESFEVNTGFSYNRKQFMLIKDFLLSNEKFIYDDLKRVIVPIKVVGKSFQFEKDGQGLYAIKFEYQYRFEDESYSLETFNFNPAEGDIGEVINNNDDSTL